MKRYLICLLILALSPALWGQDLGRFEEVTAGNFFGLGARQMSMGGAGIAASLDGAALYYNPAALARIHRIEFQLGLTHQKFSNETSQEPGRYDSLASIVNSAGIDQTKTRLGSLILTIPVPTYRGSLSVAFGINRIMSFDRASLFNVIDRRADGLVVDDYSKEFETGSIYLYSAGAGIEVSPSLSVGLALNVYSGKDDFIYNYSYLDETNDYSESLRRQVTEDYIGASLKGGLLARPNDRLAIGLTVETPLDWQVEQTVLEGDIGETVEYDLMRPFIFGTGAAFSIGRLTLTGDAEYADWSQMSYNDNPDMEIDNDSLTLLYRDVVTLRGGAEYQFPNLGLALRAGLFSQPLPYDKPFIEKDQKGFSLGAGWLIDQILLLEVAYLDGSFTRRYTPANGIPALADDSYRRVYATLSYRY